MKIIGKTSSELWKESIRYQFRYSALGLVAGLSCIFVGAFLCLHGVTADARNLKASWSGLQTSATDLPSGSLMIMAGLAVILITRFVVVSRTDGHLRVSPKTPQKSKKL